MTADEVLKQMQIAAVMQTDNPVCVIDAQSRTITVPEQYKLFGVENDKRVERVYFQCPKIVGDNQDLSQDYQLFINYENANGDPDAYRIDDMTVEGENITFSWLLEENVTKYKGNIKFAFGAIKPGDELLDPDKNRWNTTINADCTCLVGLKCTQQVAESNPDALVQIWAAIDELKAGGGSGGTTNYENLSNKPRLNGVTLEGNKTLDQVGVLAKNQGSSNSGKYLSVGSDGNVVPADAPSVDSEQIKQAVNGYLEENPVQPTPIDKTLTIENEAADAKITGEKLSGKVDKKQGVKFESIGFGKACRYGTGYFTGNIIDESTTVYGSFGIIIECNAGDTLYCNFALASSGTTSVQILDNIPTKNNGTLTGVIGTISQQENGEYKIPDNLTNAKAAFFPQKFWSYPSEKPETFDKNYGITVQTQPFDIFPAIYNSSYISEMQNENLYVDQDKNMVLYASLYKAVSDMVGAKVYISGDSITEQSAAIVSGDGTQKGWYDRIGIKYMQQYEAHGHSGNMWYTSSTLQNSAVEDVKSIVEAGIEYDYVVFEWGTNDITLGNFGNADDQASADTNCGTVAAIKYCIENLQSNFPKTRIIVIMPCMRNKNPRQEQYYDLVDPILRSYGVRRVYMAYDSGITVSMMNSDGIHFRYQDTDGTYKQNMIGLEKYSKCLEAEMLKA